MPATGPNQRRPRPVWLQATFAVAALLLALAGERLSRAAGIDSGFVVPPPATLGPGPSLDEYVVTPTGIAHAVSVTATPDGRFAAFWYEGARETSPDVRIMTASRSSDGWTPPLTVTGAAATTAETGRYARFVGNATVIRHPDGEYWMFYVSAAVGGWSGAELNLKRSSDAVTWGPAKRLYASPFFNRSTLVRAPPIALRDGRIAVPVYDEMLSAVAALIVVDRDGDIVDRIRIGAGGWAIQPWVVPLDERRAVAFMRTADESRPTVWRSETRDGGASWSALQPTTLLNPASSVAAARLDDGAILLAGNISSLRVGQFAIARSRDEGRTWSEPTLLLDGRSERRLFRYPWLSGEGGQLHLFLSEYLPGNRRSIRHLVIDPATLKPADGG